MWPVRLVDEGDLGRVDHPVDELHPLLAEVGDGEGGVAELRAAEPCRRGPGRRGRCSCAIRSVQRSGSPASRSAGATRPPPRSEIATPRCTRAAGWKAPSTQRPLSAGAACDGERGRPEQQRRRAPAGRPRAGRWLRSCSHSSAAAELDGGRQVVVRDLPLGAGSSAWRWPVRMSAVRCPDLGAGSPRPRAGRAAARRCRRRRGRPAQQARRRGGPDVRRRGSCRRRRRRAGRRGPRPSSVGEPACVRRPPRGPGPVAHPGAGERGGAAAARVGRLARRRWRPGRSTSLRAAPAAALVTGSSRVIEPRRAAGAAPPGPASDGAAAGSA